MIGLEEYKKALGTLASELSEKEILELREHQDREADVYFDMWLKTIKQSKENVV